MPLYRFQCPDGHDLELLRPRGTEKVWCGCGLAAARQSVYLMAQIRPWASEFRWSSDMKDAHEEAVGAKADMKRVLAEERANGFPA